MRKPLMTAGIALGLLTACSAQQAAVVQSSQAKVQAAISTACAAVNAAAALAAPFRGIPKVGSILDYATAGCGTAVAIAALTTKALSDSTTIAWAQQLATDIKAVVPAKS